MSDTSVVRGESIRVMHPLFQVGEGVMYPFAFYEIKSGREEQVPVDHDLVKRYATAENWPEPGTIEYGIQLIRYLKNTRELLADTQRTAAFYEREVALCEELDQRHLEIATATKEPKND